MTAPDETELAEAMARTWPPAAVDDASAPGWRLREGRGGGKRVSAATSLGALDPAPLAAILRARGETPMVQVVASETELDQRLADAGWVEVDATILYVAPAEAMAALSLPKGVRFATGTARLALLAEIWEAEGIGAARQAVMERCAAPKAILMGRTDDVAAGAAFVAAHGRLAMLHAVAVRPEHRRRGVGRALLAGAGRFGLDQGAPWVGLAVAEANETARALYDAAGMTRAARYLYRVAPDTQGGPT
ncbi:MAG: GNAT family N-acetyltransferase [Pseudomonadota bacterium]